MHQIERLLVNRNARDYLYNLYTFPIVLRFHALLLICIEYGRNHYPYYFDADFLIVVLGREVVLTIQLVMAWYIIRFLIS